MVRGCETRRGLVCGDSPGRRFARRVLDRAPARSRRHGDGVSRHPSAARPPGRLKVLVPELAEDEGFRQRFVQESQRAASLDHPTSFRSTTPTRTAASSSSRCVTSRGRISGSCCVPRAILGGRTAEIVAEVRGTRRRARTGLVHRDVKPANILIQEPGGKVFLSDFGVAKRPSSVGPTKTGSLIGSVDYCPPEQIHGQPLDGRADVYSLGCVAFHCLAGQPPFPKETDVAVIQAHLAEPVPALSTVRPGLPRALDGVLATAMAKHREVRYASAGQFAAAFKVAVRRRGLASDCRPPSSSRHVGDRLRRGDSRSNARFRQSRDGAGAGTARSSRASWVCSPSRVPCSRSSSSPARACTASAPRPRHRWCGNRRSTSHRQDRQPLVALQAMVTARVSVLEGTAGSFASMRRAAFRTRSGDAARQGTAAVLNSSGPAGRRAKSAFAGGTRGTGRLRPRARGSACTVCPQPRSSSDDRGSRRFHPPGLRNASDETGRPCCPAMPVGRASAHRLDTLAARPRSATELKAFTSAIETYLVQSSSGRSEITSALADAASCSTSPADAAVRVESVADNRQSILNQGTSALRHKRPLGSLRFSTRREPLDRGRPSLPGLAVLRREPSAERLLASAEPGLHDGSAGGSASNGRKGGLRGRIQSAGRPVSHADLVGKRGLARRGAREPVAARTWSTPAGGDAQQWWHSDWQRQVSVQLRRLR